MVSYWFHTVVLIAYRCMDLIPMYEVWFSHFLKRGFPSRYQIPLGYLDYSDFKSGKCEVGLSHFETLFRVTLNFWAITILTCIWPHHQRETSNWGSLFKQENSRGCHFGANLCKGYVRLTYPCITPCKSLHVKSSHARVSDVAMYYLHGLCSNYIACVFFPLVLGEYFHRCN